MRTNTSDAWPDLPYAEWQDTCTTLHLWSQIVGKVRVALAPWLNHSWHVVLYPTIRGLTTSPMPGGPAGSGRELQIDFDFVEHVLELRTSGGDLRTVRLEPRSVADFHAAVTGALAELGLDVHVDGAPNEVPEATPFAEDTTHAAYDPEYAHRFWRALLSIHQVFERFRTGFLGKCSPAHFFWGSFDIAVTRFSGRPAPAHPGGFPNLPDTVTREAYSHEVSSAGFWPGGGPIDYAAFYSYAYPVPAGFGARPVRPDAATFHEGLGEFLLPYEAVRTATDPEGALTDFLQSTYEAAADAGAWDRSDLECELGRPGVPRSIA